MDTPTGLQRARTAYAERRWADVVAAFADEPADVKGTDPDDLVRSSVALSLLGRTEDAIQVRTLAHEGYLARGDVAEAVRCAVWISLGAMDLGDRARAMGWLGRARRLVDGMEEPGAVAGFVLIPEGLGTLYGGEVETAARIFGEALAIAEREGGDADLAVLAMLGTGQSNIARGDRATGFRLLDEAMVAVTAGEPGPIASGIVYCAVIGFCHLAFELRRATEWTRALENWCERQQALVAFSGQCQAHRSQLFRLRGEWDAALDAARLAEQRLNEGDNDAAWGAHYQQAEVHRLRGDFTEAEAEYLLAGESGWDPQPGLALLHQARGGLELAQGMIRRSVETPDVSTRCHRLPALVEIELAAGDLEAARRAADELTGFADSTDAPMLHAVAAFANGAVLLAEGDADSAMRHLTTAAQRWSALGAPYEAARSRLLLGRAHRALGDEQSASESLRQARTVFAALGARPALAEVDSELVTGNGVSADGPLTAREVEVLRLVCAGLTNRAIASELVLSEKTVARHLSNIFAKLDVPSRAAATAYAYEHGLVEPSE